MYYILALWQFHMVEAAYKVKEARKQLFSETGKQPNNEQVAAAAGVSMKRLDAVMLAPKAPRSLDQKFGANMDLKPSVCPKRLYFCWFFWYFHVYDLT